MDRKVHTGNNARPKAKSRTRKPDKPTPGILPSVFRPLSARKFRSESPLSACWKVAERNFRAPAPISEGRFQGKSGRVSNTDSRLKKMKDVVKQRNSPNEGENGSFLSELSPTRSTCRMRLQLLFGTGNVTLPPQTQRHKKSPARTDRANPTTEAQAMQSRCPWIATP